MSLLEQNTIRKGQADKLQTELDKNNSEKYKIKAICNSVVYNNKSEGHLSGFYYIIL